MSEKEKILDELERLKKTYIMHYVIIITHWTIGGVKERPELFLRGFFSRKQAEKYFEKECERKSRDMNKYLGCTKEISKENYKRFDVKFNIDDEEIKITSEVFRYVPLVSVFRWRRTARRLWAPVLGRPSQMECGHADTAFHPSPEELSREDFQLSGNEHFNQTKNKIDHEKNPLQ